MSIFLGEKNYINHYLKDIYCRKRLRHPQESLVKWSTDWKYFKLIAADLLVLHAHYHLKEINRQMSEKKTENCKFFIVFSHGEILLVNHTTGEHEMHCRWFFCLSFMLTLSVFEIWGFLESQSYISEK